MRPFLRQGDKYADVVSKCLEYRITRCPRYFTTNAEFLMRPFLRQGDKFTGLVFKYLEYRIARCPHYLTTNAEFLMRPFLRQGDKMLRRKYRREGFSLGKLSSIS